MKLLLFKDHDTKEERVEVYYKKDNYKIDEIKKLLDGESKDFITCYDELGCSKIVSIKDIIYIESMDGRNYIQLDIGRYVIRDSLNNLVKRFYCFGLVRVNKASMVNINYVKMIKPDFNMRTIAVMDDGNEIFINRSYKKSFNNYLKEYKL